LKSLSIELCLDDGDSCAKHEAGYDAFMT